MNRRIEADGNLERAVGGADPIDRRRRSDKGRDVRINLHHRQAKPDRTKPGSAKTTGQRVEGKLLMAIDPDRFGSDERSAVNGGGRAAGDARVRSRCGFHLVGGGIGRNTAARRVAQGDAAQGQAVKLNGIDGIALTKLDVLDGLSEIKVCVGYELDGRTIER